MALSSESLSRAMQSNQDRHDDSMAPRRQQNQHELLRMPSLQRVTTTMPQNLSITPASARSISSQTASPYFTSVHSSPSLGQASYSIPRLASPGPFELPEPMFSPFSANASPQPAKDGHPGLIRKLSQSAKGQISSTRNVLRRKTSSNNQRKREESTGPLARRRSDSRTGVSTLSIEPTTVDIYNLDFAGGLNIMDTQSITSEPSTIASSFSIPPVTAAAPAASFGVPTFPGLSPEGQAPSVPDELVRGCALLKIGKDRAERIDLYLDTTGSRVYWKGRLSTKSIHIDNIKSVRSGEEIAPTPYEFRGDPIDQHLCFDINYTTSDSSNRVKTLSLVAFTLEDMDLWVNTLHILYKHREQMMTSMVGTTERERVIRFTWEKEIQAKAGSTGPLPDERLDLLAVQRLCQRLHIHCQAQDLANTFKAAANTNSSSLDYIQFKDFLRRLRERKDLLQVFNSLRSRDVDNLSVDQFLAFLENMQGFDLRAESVRQHWIDKAHELADLSTASTDTSEAIIDYAAFASFVSSENCHIFATDITPTPKFDQPLSAYYISSSHNTYLTGWQVNGHASAEAYVTALRHGCRCVEIDCWNGSDGNPKVTHGHTHTSDVSFVDCVNAINRCAFDVSPYPIIISLEVHCDEAQQAKMFHTLVSVFGDKLVEKLLDGHTIDLPSPEELQYRVLIKVKSPHAFPPFVSRANSNVSRKRSDSSPYPVEKATVPASPVPPIPGLASPVISARPEAITSPTDPSSFSAGSAEEESDAQPFSPSMNGTPTRRTKSSKITPLLSSLGVYTQGFSLRDAKDLNFRQFNHIFSFNETRGLEFCNRGADTKALFENHNVDCLSRVYPKTMRLRSDNFDANIFWKRGVQMVALNWQTYDPFMQMYQAMFAAGNDRYGYVLKPDYMRVPVDVDQPFVRRKQQRFDMKFSVKIISAQQLPRPQSLGKGEALNPFVEVQMFSAEDKQRGIANGTGGQGPSLTNSYHGIGSPYCRRSRVVLGNGYNPQFDDKIDLCLETKYPELVFVRFIVFNCVEGKLHGEGKPHHRGCKQVAVFTAKLSSIQEGYRHIPLYNGNGEEFIFSTLFCQITKHKPDVSNRKSQDITERLARSGGALLKNFINRGLSSDRGRERSSSIEERQALIKEKH